MPAAWDWVAELLTGEETRRNSRACVEQGARNTGFNASWSPGDALVRLCRGGGAAGRRGRDGGARALCGRAEVQLGFVGRRVGGWGAGGPWGAN